jgi:hypothetical protein
VTQPMIVSQSRSRSGAEPPTVPAAVVEIIRHHKSRSRCVFGAPHGVHDRGAGCVPKCDLQEEPVSDEVTAQWR